MLAKECELLHDIRKFVESSFLPKQEAQLRKNGGWLKQRLKVGPDSDVDNVKDHISKSCALCGIGITQDENNPAFVEVLVTEDILDNYAYFYPDVRLPAKKRSCKGRASVSVAPQTQKRQRCQAAAQRKVERPMQQPRARCKDVETADITPPKSTRLTLGGVSAHREAERQETIAKTPKHQQAADDPKPLLPNTTSMSVAETPHQAAPFLEAHTQTSASVAQTPHQAAQEAATQNTSAIVVSDSPGPSSPRKPSFKSVLLNNIDSFCTANQDSRLLAKSSPDSRSSCAPSTKTSSSKSLLERDRHGGSDKENTSKFAGNSGDRLPGLKRSRAFEQPSVPVPMSRESLRDSSLSVLPREQIAASPLITSRYVTYSPSSTSFNGLKNLGNTCYMNAIMQVICALRAFIADVAATSRDIDRDEVAPPILRFTLDVARHMSRDNALPRGSLDMRDLHQCISKEAPKFSGTRQHDAHEFFLEYVNQLHSQLVIASKQASQLAAPMSSKTPATLTHLSASVLKRLTCTKCLASHQVTETFFDLSLDFPQVTETFFDLSLDFPGQEEVDVTSMLGAYFSDEAVEAKCEKCGCADATMSKAFGEVPGVLALHLKRFVANRSGLAYDKRHHKVGIPMALDLQRFCRPCLGSTSGGEGGMYNQADLSYELSSVVAHSGWSPHCGHYVTYSREDSGCWRLFDDTIVRDEGPNMPENLGRDAYMLIYTRKACLK